MLMPWVRLDDHFDEHPKIAALGDSALAMWVCGLAYCNRNLTDGFIPHMVGLGKLRWCDGNTTPAIRELETCGLWEPADGGWHVHDFDDYQPTKEATLQERVLKASAGRLGGLRTQTRVRDGEIDAPVKARHAQAKANLKADALACDQADVKAHLKPVPVPVPDKTRSVAFAPPTVTECEAKAAELGMPDSEGTKFWHFYNSKGWVVGRTKMKQWRSCMVTWHSRWKEEHGSLFSGNNGHDRERFPDLAATPMPEGM